MNASHTSKPEFHFNYNSNKLVPESNFNSRANSQIELDEKPHNITSDQLGNVALPNTQDIKKI